MPSIAHDTSFNLPTAKQVYLHLTDGDGTFYALFLNSGDNLESIMYFQEVEDGEVDTMVFTRDCFTKFTQSTITRLTAKHTDQLEAFTKVTK